MKPSHILSIAIVLVLGSLYFVLSPITEGQTPAKKSPRHEKVKAGFGVSVVQTQPEFPGGSDSLLSYLKKNIHYPEQALTNRQDGQVYVGFTIDSVGKVSNARVVSGISAELDSAAIRIIQGMPDWKPGTAGGSPVNVHYILPVDFVLPKL